MRKGKTVALTFEYIMESDFLEGSTKFGRTVGTCPDAKRTPSAEDAEKRKAVRFNG